jgi:hypothetical protein
MLQALRPLFGERAAEVSFDDGGFHGRSGQLPNGYGKRRLIAQAKKATPPEIAVLTSAV